jgi:RIO-like serine/threonine protein kinase
MKIKSIGNLIRNNISYVLTDCQSSLNSSIEQTKNDWIELQKVFQNLQGKNIATILGVLENNKNVVVKIQPIDESRKEYEIHNILKKERGFIVFHCFVTCGSPIEYINLYKPKQKICDKKGNTLGIIVMPYYKNGSFEEFLQNNNKHKYTNHITVLAILSYYMAYKKLGFVHGDFYTKNVVVDENYRPLIIDFEHSSFNSGRKVSLFWRDIENFLNCIYPFVDKRLDTIIRTQVVMNNAYNIEPNETIMKRLTDDLMVL